MLGILLPFALKFLGEGVIGKMLSHRREIKKSANERDRIRLDHEIKILDHEVKRRDQQRDIQLKEMEHPYLWWPKFALSMSVCGYWAARFLVKMLGLGDFGVAVSALSTEEAAVSGIVVGALYLPVAWKKAIRGTG